MLFIDDTLASVYDFGNTVSDSVASLKCLATISCIVDTLSPVFCCYAALFNRNAAGYVTTTIYTEICIVIRCMALIFGANDIDEIAYNDIGILTCLDFLFLL